MKRILSAILIAFLLTSFVFYKRSHSKKSASFVYEPEKVLGSSAAEIFILEFSDFACPYCNKARAILKELEQAYRGKLKIIFKHFPLQGSPNSPIAAAATECAADQKKFWAYHDIVFEKALEWMGEKDPTPLFRSYAEIARLNTEAFNACMSSGKKNSIVASNKQEGEDFYVEGTPTLILNGKKIIVDYSLEDLKQVIDNELAKKSS